MKKKLLISLLLVICAFTLSACDSKLSQMLKGGKTLSPDKIKTLTETYINDNLMTPGSKATITGVTEENGLYKVMVDIGQGQPIESYVTKDGTKFFPQVLAIKTASSTEAAASDTPSATAPKTDKPVVELFVMSYCPYGLQIEKGILPAVEALKGKIDFKLKFCDYAMHEKKELDENLIQYCISKEQNDKLIKYLTCFNTSGKSDDCIKQAGVNATQAKNCATKTDKEFKVTENYSGQKEFKGSYPSFNVFKADNAKYNVGGSPTLIINGTEIQSERDPQSLLTTICSSFKTQPKECQNKLSATAPAPGFGSGADTTGGSAAAGCEN